MNIRQKFVTLLLLIGLLPMLAVSVIAFNTISGALLNSTGDQLNSLAIKQEQRISTLLQNKREEVVKLSNQYDFQVSLRKYNATVGKEGRDTLGAILQSKKVDVPTIQAMYLTGADGSAIATSEIGGRTLAERGGATSLDVTETNVAMRKDPVDGFSKLFITTAVTINKQKAGLLTAIFRTDDLVAVVQDYTGLDETGETVVVAKDGVSLFPLRFDTEAGLRTSLASLDLFKNVDVPHKEAVDYRKKDILLVAHDVGLTDWVVATKIDKDEAFAPITLLRNSMVVILLFVSLGIVLVALFFTRLFTGPILQIGRVSERIGRGDFAARTTIERSDEIGTLAHSVNTMGMNLSGLVGNIESQRRRLQIILDNITEGIFAIDEHDNVLLANKAVQGLLLVDPVTLVGKNMQELFHMQHGLQDFTPDYQAEGVHVYTNLQYIDSANAQRYVKLIVTRVKEGVGSAARAIVTIHDETSSHELENMKTDFVSMAAHELRTPLTAIRGYLEVALFKDGRHETADLMTYVRQALKNVAELGGLINNLLDVTRIERGTLTLNMEKVDVAAETARAVEDARFAAEDKKLSISYAGPTSGVYAVADSLALHEVVNNLVSNAIKYTMPDGKVEVVVSQDDANCTVSVKDSGVGIAKNAQQYLFTKFYRVHGGLDSGSTGTGLGLFIAKSIIDRHRGTIKVESEEGKGSTFTLSLPVFTAERLAQLQPITDNAGEANIRRKRGWITKNIAR